MVYDFVFNVYHLKRFNLFDSLKTSILHRCSSLRPNENYSFFMIHTMVTTPAHAPVRLGIDFIGGTLLEYQFEKPLLPTQLPKLTAALTAAGVQNPVVQLQQKIAMPISNEQSADLKLSPPKKEPTAIAQTGGTLVSIRTQQLSPETLKKLEPQLEKTFGAVELTARNAIGPTLAKELLGNSVMALILAYLLITGYLTYRFQLDYAVCAILALLHDTLFVLGVFVVSVSADVTCVVVVC